MKAREDDEERKRSREAEAERCKTKKVVLVCTVYAPAGSGLVPSGHFLIDKLNDLELKIKIKIKNNMNITKPPQESLNSCSFLG